MREALWQTWQGWRRAKGLAALAMLAMAVGIGASTAIYTVVDAVLVRPLPYPGGDRFVAIYGASADDPVGRSSHSLPHLRIYQERTRTFDLFGWFTLNGFNLSNPGPAQHVNGAAVTPSLALQLRVPPALGRWFRDESEVVISHALWTRLGAETSIIGSPMALNGRSYTVTGVMPAGFRLPVAGAGGGRVDAELWIPLDPLGRGQDTGQGVYFAYARRKPGITLAQARADVAQVAAGIRSEDRTLPSSYTARVDDLHADAVETIGPTLLLLMGAAGLLLLITCANVAGLLLTRSITRSRETAVRVALGAGSWNLAVQHLLEGLFVAVPGAAAGAVASLVVVRIIVVAAAEYLPQTDGIGVDWRVVLFAAAVTAFAGALSSVAPLIQAARTRPADALQSGLRVSTGARGTKMSRRLVVAEVALAFSLLVGSTALVLQLTRLNATSPGFDVDNLLTFELMASGDTAATGTFSSSQARAAYFRRLLDAVAAVPGVESAATVTQLPLDGCCFGTSIHPEGRLPDRDTAQKNALVAVSADYFRTMRIPLRSGRLLETRDERPQTLRVVINEAAARRFWPDRDPVGAFGRLSSPAGTRFEIVGVVGDVRNDGLGRATVPEIYVPSTVLQTNPVSFAVRSPLAPAALMPAIRRAVQSVERGQPIQQVTPMTSILVQSLARERLGSMMTSFFALIALLMATLGIYGVVAYSVRRGTRDIGTRIALGAATPDVLRLFVGSGVRMAIYGVIIGAAAAASAAWMLLRVWRIEDLGWEPFAAAAIAVTVVAATASLIPAWRASRVSPIVAIRHEG